MHHATLKAAIAKYLPFHTAGANAEEVKAEIKKDEKGFDEAAVDEIYKAIMVEAGDKEKGPDNPGTSEKGADEGASGAGSGDNKGKKKKHIVVKPFSDINNFDKKYNPGDDVSDFDAERLTGLVTKGLVEIK